MPRKNPSSHSDAQFAAFVDRMGGGSGQMNQAQFTQIVRGLIRVEGEEPATTDPAGGKNELVRPRKAARPADLLPPVDQLACDWSNSQGLLVRLLALMLQADTASAAAIFSIVRTTQLRLDLLRLLALLKVGDRQTLDELLKIIDGFDHAGRLRDELARALDQGRLADIAIARDCLRLVRRSLEKLMSRLPQNLDRAASQAAAD